MTQPHTDNHQFWSGFSFGLLGGAALLYFFATPKGRGKLKQYLEHAEVVEHDIGGLLNLLKEASSLPQSESPDGARENVQK